MRTRRKSVYLRIYEEDCTGCGNCVPYCRRGVIGMNTGTSGVRAIVEDLDNCVGCGRCSRACKSGAIELMIF